MDANMSAKPPASPRTLAEINKQIIEIKKKIQLSEGQRKAAFEEYESERKQNADLILKLKKENKELITSLHKNKDESAVYRVRNLHLESIIGPLINKTTEQVTEALDLQIIDRTKHLDLIKHRVKEHRNYLTKLAKEYQTLLSQKPKEEVKNSLANLSKKPKKKNKTKSDKCRKNMTENEIASPYRKKFYTLQNNIHRVEVQWREAEYVRNSYKAIRSTLLKERACFESSLQELEEKKQVQQKEIQELQRMNAEAAATRSSARLALDREERISVQSSRIRERQVAEQEAIVAEKLQELERLERRIFQSSKTGGGNLGGVTTGRNIIRGAIGPNEEGSRPETGEDTERGEESPERENEENEKWVMATFEKLKEATGASSSKDVLSKFQAQKDTRSRLNYLKNNTEGEKQQLEINQEALHNEVEKYRYAQEKEKEKFGDDIITLKTQIETETQNLEKCKETIESQQDLLNSMCKAIYNIYVALKEVGVKPSKEINSDPQNSEILIITLQKELENLVKRNEDLRVDEEELEILEEELPSEDEMLPATYNVLLRRTPLPIQGQTMQMIAPTPVTEDDEEVPSRNFLKRQAQLVVDAKSRRKAFRIPVARK